MPRSTADPEHLARLQVPARGASHARAPDTPDPRLGLSWLDKAHVEAFLGTDLPDVSNMVRDTAEALADDDRDAAAAARQRLLARLTAAEKATLDVLVGMLGDHVRQGLHDERAVRVARVLDTLANSACRRVTWLLAAAERRVPGVAIENAIVRIEAAE